MMMISQTIRNNLNCQSSTLAIPPRLELVSGTSKSKSGKRNVSGTLFSPLDPAGGKCGSFSETAPHSKTNSPVAQTASLSRTRHGSMLVSLHGASACRKRGSSITRLNLLSCLKKTIRDSKKGTSK